jgi:hypothetical protein
MIHFSSNSNNNLSLLLRRNQELNAKLGTPVIWHSRSLSLNPAWATQQDCFQKMKIKCEQKSYCGVRDNKTYKPSL